MLTVDSPDRWADPIVLVDPTKPLGPTVVLLNDTRDQISVGSNALTDGLITILSRSLPNATILPIPSHWLIDKSSWASAFVHSGVGMRQPAASYPTLADQFDTIADDWSQGRGGPGAREILARFEGADLVVLNGEGSLYRTNQSAIRELFLAWLCRVRLDIPTVYLNGGLHLTGVMPILPAMVRKTFRVLDAVAVREPCSLRNLEEYVPGIDAHVVPDAAFVLTPGDANESDAVRAVRERIDGSPYFCFDPGAMPMDTRGGERSALYQMISTLKRVVPQGVFVSHSPPDDYIAEVAELTGSIYVDNVREYREFMALVSGAQFLVSGRHHNLILAAITGCPTIGFGATTHKVHGACEWLEGLVAPPYDGTDLRSQLDAIEQQARAYVENRDALRGRLLEVCDRRRSEALQLGQIAIGALGSNVSRREERAQAFDR